MLRVQAQLTEDQSRRLKALAAAEGVSVAELLRRGADLVLAGAGDRSPEARRERARAVVGAFSDERADVAERHDHYLDRRAP